MVERVEYTEDSEGSGHEDGGWREGGLAYTTAFAKNKDKRGRSETGKDDVAGLKCFIILLFYCSFSSTMMVM